MVGYHGMSPVVGRVHLLRRDERYLETEASFANVSSQLQAELDREVRRLIAAAERVATDVLAAQRVHLDVMAEQLMDEETLEGSALADLLARVS